MSPGALDRKMCNSSVEPTPSRMSTPKRAFQALPTDSGSASPAEVQMRRRVPARVVLQRLVVEHRREQRRHADRRCVGLYLFNSANISAGVGRSALRTVVAPTDIGKRQRIAEAVGEEQFCRRQPDIVLANAEHLLGIGLRGRGEIGMQMPHALGHAGRARRIEPERRLVGVGRRGRKWIALAARVRRRASCGRARSCRTPRHARDRASARPCP